MTRRKLAVIALVLLLLAGATGVYGPRVARRMPFFAVQRVEITGSLFLDKNDIVRRLNLRAGASVLDPIAPVEAAAAVIPGVVAVRVTRRLPGTLQLQLHEAKPVALSEGTDRLVMLDHAARVLPFDPTRSPTSLPIADRNPATTALLARIMMSDPEWFDTIDAATFDDGDIIVESSGHRVRVRAGASNEVLRSVALVRDYLAQQAVSWAELDARYVRRVFVRRRQA